MQNNQAQQYKQLQSWQVFIDFLKEDVVIINADYSVVMANLAARQHFGFSTIEKGRLTCEDFFQGMCVKCTDCPIQRAINERKSERSKFKSSPDALYEITVKTLENAIDNQLWLLCAGRQMSNKKSTSKNTENEKFSGTWRVELNQAIEITKSNQYAYQFSGITKETLEKEKVKFETLLPPEYKEPFKAYYEEAQRNGQSGELRLLIQRKDNTFYGGDAAFVCPEHNSNNQITHIIIKPLKYPVFDSRSYFDYLRLQNYIYIIAEQMAQSQTVAEGYRSVVYSVSQVLGVNLCGFIHFDVDKNIQIEAAIGNGKFYDKHSPHHVQKHMFEDFYQRLQQHGTINIPDVSKVDPRYKKRLENEQLGSFFAYPLNFQKRLVGAIILGYPHPYQWPDHKLDFIKTIGSLILQSILQEETREKLRRLNENFVNIFENSSDAVFIVALNGRILEVNRMAETLSGYSKNELLQKNVSDISKAENLDLEQMPYEMLQSHQMVFGTDLVAHNGETIPVETREKMIRYQEKIAILVIARDVRHRRELNRMMVQTISETQDKERQRIAEGLHDDVGPLLSTLRIYIDLLNNAQLSKDEIEDYSIKMNDIINQAISTVREVSRNLMPGVLNDFGLIEAIQDFCQKINRTGIIRIIFDHDAKYYNLDDKIKNVIFSVVKELINNSIKHADASQINLSVNKNESGLCVQYNDNGIGLNIEKQLSRNYDGQGLKNLLSKINAVEGKVTVTGKEGFGICISFPLNQKIKSQ